MSFAPAVQVLPDAAENYLLANTATLAEVIGGVQWDKASRELYERTLSAIQNISTVRRARTPRHISSPESRGAKLQHLEDSIATLDMLQSKAVIETVDGVQRIRGLAGSGKTIVLALKAAYLHARHPDWRIAVTFNTRSLKDQFRRLITASRWKALARNLIGRTCGSSIPGCPGGPDRDGLYYEFCARNNVEYLDFRTARSKYGRDGAFAGACDAAFSAVGSPPKLYDAILVDEAQDLPAEFLRLCYWMLDDYRHLVYAYDELQALDGQGLPPAADIFGKDDNGAPRVTLNRGPQSTVPAATSCWKSATAIPAQCWSERTVWDSGVSPQRPPP